MNYDAFERNVLGHGRWITLRAEQRRLHRANLTPAPAPRPGAGVHAVRFQLALALRSLADLLDTPATRLA